MNQPRKVHESGFRRVLTKMFVSGFVVLSFAAYVVHERISGSDQAGGANTAPPAAVITTRVPSARATVVKQPPSDEETESQSEVATEQPVEVATEVPQVVATEPPPPPTDVPVVIAPTAKPVNASGYQDGAFKGQVEDAYFGLVQVQATIQDGKIASVEFLEYPRDRRTSQQINSFAMPYLQQEAIQAQNAQVDIISGATLTSEAFIRSLQTALASSKNGS